LALQNLKFTQPTPIQLKSIPFALQGNDLFVSAETGSGKTAAFLIPIIHKLLENSNRQSGTRALILVPTRELAQQVLTHCQQLTAQCRIQTGLIMGGETFKEQKAMLRKNPEIIIATPGRLLEHIQRQTCDLDDLEFLVLDEADRMLDMGLSEIVLDVAANCNSKGAPRQTFLYSATLNQKKIAEVAKQLLKDPVTVEVGSARAEHQNITQEYITADDDEFKLKLIQHLLHSESFNKMLVFCNTRVQTEKVCKYLQSHENKIIKYLHGEMTQDDRNVVIANFRKKTPQILVATDVAARGLDIKQVNVIINFDMAQSADDHIHRIGRTGRAGAQGLAISLVSAQEWKRKLAVENYLKSQMSLRIVNGLTSKFKGLSPAPTPDISTETKPVKKMSTPKSEKSKSKGKIDKVKVKPSKEFQRDGFAPFKRS